MCANGQGGGGCGVKSLLRSGLLQMAVLLLCGLIANIQIGFIGPLIGQIYVSAANFTQNIYSSAWILLIFGQGICGLVPSVTEW